MTSLLKNLTGRAAKDRELTDEMRAILLQIQQECARYEVLVDRARTSAERLEHLSEPIARVSGETAAVESHLGELSERLSSLAPAVAQPRRSRRGGDSPPITSGPAPKSSALEERRIRTPPRTSGRRSSALGSRAARFLPRDRQAVQVLRRRRVVARNRADERPPRPRASSMTVWSTTRRRPPVEAR
jgi:hypothetical protein